MTSQILIAYASKYGSTHEIAERIGQTLREAGLSVDVLSVEAVQNAAAYEAIILGSAVYMGQWRAEAVKFLEANQPTLAARPTWFFSSGPTGSGDPVQLMKGWRFPTAQQAIADAVKPRDVALFHGNVDMKKLSFADKLIIRGVKAPQGEFRDWSAITAWAEGIVAALTQNRPVGEPTGGR